MGNAAASQTVPGASGLRGDARRCCGLGLDGGYAPTAYARQGERPETEFHGGGEGSGLGDFDDEETQPGLIAPASKDDAGAAAASGKGGSADRGSERELPGSSMVFGSSARAHRPSVVLKDALPLADSPSEEYSTPGNPDLVEAPAGRRRSSTGGPRMMRDSERGMFGPGVCRMLEQPHEADIGPGTRYVRVGTPRDGTCFFHSVLASLNLDMRLAMAPGRNKLNDAQFGQPSERSRAYRNLTAAERRAAGAQWRKHLARRVTENWFRRNLHTDTPDRAASVYCPARDRQIDMDTYVRDYADPEMYVGDSVWPHVAEQAGVNIFFLVQSNHGDSPDAAADDLPRVYTATKYDTERKSIFLLLLDRGGSRGHYESLQTADGVGCFSHFDPVTQLVLERQRLQNCVATPR